MVPPLKPGVAVHWWDVLYTAEQSLKITTRVVVAMMVFCIFLAPGGLALVHHAAIWEIVAISSLEMSLLTLARREV